VKKKKRNYFFSIRYKPFQRCFIDWRLLSNSSSEIANRMCFKMSTINKRSVLHWR